MLKKVLYYSGFIVVLSTGIVMVSGILYLKNQTAFTTLATRESLRRIVTAYWVSKITGAYWENSIYDAINEIDDLPLNDQLIFYRELLIFTAEDLDTTKAYAYISGVVHTDIKKLRGILQNFVLSDRAKALPAAKFNAIKGWLLQLEIVEANCTGLPAPCI